MQSIRKLLLEAFELYEDVTDIKTSQVKTTPSDPDAVKNIKKVTDKDAPENKNDLNKEQPQAPEVAPEVIEPADIETPDATPDVVEPADIEPEKSQSNYDKLISYIQKLNSEGKDFDIPVSTSSALSRIVYRPSTKALAVTFKKNGRQYVYKDVDINKLVELVLSDEKGRYFNREIKPNSGYTEVG